MTEEQFAGIANPGPGSSHGSIDALLALQGQNDPAERRRRAVGRGRNALDTLDAVKVELLAGTFGPASLARLKSVATDFLESSGDGGLDVVIAEINLRVEVQIAKLSPK